MGDVNTWVGDQLLNLLGASDSALVSYFTTLSGKAKNAGALYSSLVANGLPESASSQRFANELFNKTPRASGSSSSLKAAQAIGAAAKEKRLKEERTREEERKRALGSQKFSLVLDDEATDDAHQDGSGPIGSTSKSVTSSKSEKKAKSSSSAARRRERDGHDGWDEERESTENSRKATTSRQGDEGPQNGREDGDGNGDEETPEEYAARRERERLEDLKERDEFDKRMKARDKDKGKKGIVEDRTMTAEQRARKLLQEDAEKAAAAMPNLRDYSRQEYLKKREQQRIDLLRLEIQDFERDTRGQKLTKRELRELESKKEVLRLTEERLRIDDGFDGYMMPEDYLTEQGKLDARRKKEVLYKRYEDSKRARDQEQFVTDLDR